jgi:tetratricopeptide (TPR) repeat protein
MSVSGKKSDRRNSLTATPSEDVIARVDELNDYAWDIHRRNVREALETCRRARELSESHSYLRGVAYSSLTCGYCYYSIGDYKTGLVEEQEAILLFEKLKDKKGKAWALSFSGLLLLEEGKFAESIERSTESLRIFEELGDQLGISKTFINTGNIYYYLGEYAKALDHFQKALRIMEGNGYREQTGYSLANIGAIYYQIGQYENSIEYLNRGLQIFRVVEDRKGQTLCLTNLGECYRITGEFDKAFALQLETLEISRENSIKYHESGAYVNLGRTYFDAGEYEKAADAYTNSLQAALEIEHKRCESEALLGLGEVFCEQTNYDKAVELLSQSLKIAQEGNFGEFIYKAHLALSRAYELQGDSVIALKHHKEFYSSRQKVLGLEVLEGTEKIAVFDEDAALKQKLLRLLKNLEIDEDSNIGSQDSSHLTQYLDKLTVKNKERIFFLKTEEIFWIEATGDYAKLHAKGQKSYLIRERMNNLERKLDPSKFLRIHRSTIINTDFIKEISPLFKSESLIILTNGKEFKVSRNYQSNLQKLLSRYS